MVTTVRPRNEERLRRAYAGFELQRGVPVEPKFRLYQRLRLTDDRPLSTDEEETGGFDPYVDSVQGAVSVTGTIAGPLAFQDVPIYELLGVKGNMAATADGGTPPAYIYPGIPSFDQDDLLSLFAEVGPPDDVYEAPMILLNEYTLSFDVDGEAAWQFSANVIARNLGEKNRATGTATSATATTIVDTSATWDVDEWIGGVVQITGGTGVGQERVITDNDATSLTVENVFDPVPDATSTYRILPTFTAGIPTLERDKIRAVGTKVYIDDTDDPLGTTQMLGRLVSGSITVQHNISTKRFAEDEDQVSSRIGRGSRVVTGQVRLEWDRPRHNEANTEYGHFQNGTPRRIRFEREGPVIHDNVRHRLRVDIPNAVYSSWSDTPRNANMGITLSFRADYDGALGYAFALPLVTNVGKTTFGL